MDQKTALKILKSGENIFLTGSAGAGKTYLLNQYIGYLREKSIPVAITASTGIAATHLGGQTIHSWAGIGIRDAITEDDLLKMIKNRPLRKRLEKAKVLIIDEISMLSGKTLEMVDEVLRFFKVSFEPFGGIQIIFSGDFFQLPPICRNPSVSAKKFAFMTPIWVKSGLKVCYLTEQFRQSHSELTQVLNDMRSGEVSDACADLLWEKLESSKKPSESHSIKLFTHNVDIERINQAELEKLSSDSELYFAKISGNKRLAENLKKSILAQEVLELKIGAPVIFVKNNYESGYFNGTLGTIIGFSVEEGFPIVQTKDDNEILVRPVDWEIDDEFGKPLAVFRQIPLRLAWAITVHKSQGMTLDAAEIDLSKTFECGQGYVALSRVKHWSGLKLLGANDKALQMDALALRADVRFQELSDEIEAGCQLIPEAEWEDLAIKFIKKCGGNSNEQ